LNHLRFGAFSCTVQQQQQLWEALGLCNATQQSAADYMQVR
jgi:hypothetical protein